MRPPAAAALLGGALLGWALLRPPRPSAGADGPAADAGAAGLRRRLLGLPREARAPEQGPRGAGEEAPPRGLPAPRAPAQPRRGAGSSATAGGAGAAARGVPQRQLQYGPPAGCYTIRDGRLLVVFHVEGMWDIPGGQAEPGETPEQTAVREAWEETGWNVSVDGLIQVTQNGFYIFRCHTITEEAHGIADPHEVVSWNWFLKADVEASSPWRFPEETELYISLF